MSSSTINPSRETSNQFNTEEHVLGVISKETEHRLHYQREQNREARQIRNKELEKNARDNDDDENSPSIPSTKSGINGTNSLLLQKFLNGDTDLQSIEKADLKRLLNELESKYKFSMINNSKMYNEKQALNYQIDLYKDTLDEHYETLNEIKRQLKAKCTDFDLQKRTLNNLQEENNRLIHILTNCEKLIQESDQRDFPDETIDERFQRILNEKHQLFEQFIQLKSELDEEKNRLRLFKEQTPIQNQNLNEIYDFEQQKQLSKQITDFKNRLQQIEADNGSLQQENKRYEAQLTRYKQELDEAERVEDKLKEEKRLFKSQLRVARDELENERLRNDVVQRENERLRTILKKHLLNNKDIDLVLSKSHSPLLPTNSNDIQSISPIEDST